MKRKITKGNEKKKRTRSMTRCLPREIAREVGRKKKTTPLNPTHYTQNSALFF
jgi:hypothetical protein